MSAFLQEGTPSSSRGEALKRLNTYMEDLRERKQPIGSLEGFVEQWGTTVLASPRHVPAAAGAGPSARGR